MGIFDNFFVEMSIHPTAIVENPDSLGPDCEVGAHAILGPEVRLGARCKIQANAVLTGKVILGDDNFVGYGAIVGGEPQDFSYSPQIKSSVRIGNRNRLREYVTIHLGTTESSETVLGDDNFLMCGVHVGHNCRIHNKTVIANNVLLAGYVEVFDAAVLGGGTAFHQYMRIGSVCMVRGGTRMGKDIPPFLIADDRNVIGLNAIGMRRAGLSPQERKEIRRAFAHVYQGGKNVGQAIETYREAEWLPVAQSFFEFIKSSKRGICPLGKSRATGTDEE